MSSDVLVLVDGVETTDARLPGATIRESLSPAPNSGRLTFNEGGAEAGQFIEIRLVSESPERILFAGEVQTAGQSYDLNALNGKVDCSLIDPAFQANCRRPFGVWVNTSATTIALSIAADYAPTFGTGDIAADLPPVSITFDGSTPFMTCFQQLATAIGQGARATVSYAGVLGLFITDPGEAPDPVDHDHPPLNTAPIVFRTDLSQVRTRIFGKGHAERVLTDIAVGEWIVPISDASMFNTISKTAIAGTVPDGAQSEVLTYESVDAGGPGSLVGPGVQPSAAPTTTPVVGAGIEAGNHDYAYTFVTAAGETTPSPLARAKVAMTAPNAPTLTLDGAGGWPLETNYYKVSVYDPSTGDESVASSASSITNTGGKYINVAVDITAAMVGLVLLCFRSSDNSNFYGGSKGSSGYWSRVIELADVGTTPILFIVPALPNATWAGLGYSTAVGFGPLTGAQQQRSISGVALGPTGTTGRNIYRTVANGSQLKLQQSVANNTSTGPFSDSTADGSLGGDAPTGDDSGLSQEDGQVNAGSTTLLLASAARFNALGGWALPSSGTPIRYNGISGNTLTGIPASGTGSIAATLQYGATVEPSPSLRDVNAGVSPNGVAVAMLAQSIVAIWVQRDDTDAQAALALIERDRDGNPTSGIREDHVFDGRMGEELLIATVDAKLAQFSDPTLSVDYETLDTKSRIGATVYVNLFKYFPGVTYFPEFYDPNFYNPWYVPYGIAGNFTIQDVTISFFGATKRPRYKVRAASVAFTIFDLLRLVQLQQG